MRIGELAATANVPSRTIRFYERRGVLPEPERHANGYRAYDHRTVERLDFIRRAQAAELTLTQIRSIIDIRAHGQSPCTHVTELLSTKLDHVRKLLEELHALKIDLVHLIQRGERLDPSRCTPGEIWQILTACQPADDID